MATIEPYFLKSGAKRYRVRYLKPDRKPTDKRGFTRKKDAEDWAAENTVKMNAGTWRPAAAGKITVNESAEAWLKAKTPNVAPKTVSAYRDAVNRIRNIGTLGSTRLLDVDHAVVEDWVTAMSAHEVKPGAKMAPKTIRNTHAVLSGVMKRAVRDKRIPSNPCEGIDLPKVPEGEQTILTPAEVGLMIGAAGDYGDVVKVLAMGGLRWGELAGLQAQDVDLKNQRLRINRQITENKGRLVHGLPKHDKRRSVPMLDPLAELLEKRIRGKSREELLFTTAGGAVLRGGNARRDWFDDAAAVAGYPDLTPHELRHTFASVAISSGANVKALQQALGHHSASFTLDVYGHLFPDDMSGFINAMSAAFTGDYGHDVGTGEKQKQARH